MEKKLTKPWSVEHGIGILHNVVVLHMALWMCRYKIAFGKEVLIALEKMVMVYLPLHVLFVNIANRLFAEEADNIIGLIGMASIYLTTKGFI